MQLKKHTRLFTAIATLLLTTPVWATNGYFTHGVGTKNKGMAGSGLAMPEDAISVANNPAAGLANAGKYDLGIAIFSPARSYETSASQANGQCSPFGCAFTIGPNDIDSDSDYFFIPHMAGAWKIGDKAAWSAAFYGKGGMNTTWNGGTATFDPSGGMAPAPMTFPGTYGSGMFGGNGATGVDLSQAFLELGYSRIVGDRFTWGASLVGVMQVFAARGVSSFGGYTQSYYDSNFTEFPQNLSNNSHDQSYGLGAKLGFQLEMSNQWSLAASYQPKIGMSKLDDYSDLFADGGNMDIPADLKVGITFHSDRGLALNFDVENIWYSDVPSVGNPFSNFFDCPTVGGSGDSSSCLGGKNGAGFGWEDMLVYKLGGQWSSGNDWTWRAGYSFGDQPIPDSETMFNILAPGVIEDHLTFGLTRKLPSGNEWSASFMYAFDKKVSGTNPLDPSQTITFNMSQWELEFGFGWR